MASVVSSVASITSFREFARNTDFRKNALREKNPIIVEDKKAKEVFFWVPQEMFSSLWEMYQDAKDAEMLAQEISKFSLEKGKNWKSLKSEILL